ncbi:hypothetical protein [Maribacter sp. HTCC2170]|uniref:hypothetical protein n=1 Tax=Maribacter sp. (strain HTCC2170 / KCCM 42371) TaxID=313603 RepID=UPI00006B4765|nr:hypothetical protein [Maribacter sp. HTCC2170]EAR01812.1 hypothetical protein FB2170_14828 [Maribacter sp. HTCC2170]
MKHINRLAHILIGSLLIMACNNGPKVIQASEEQEEPQKSGIFTPDPSTQVIPTSNQSFSNELHTVSVNEVLPATRYVYLNVSEGDSKFWIATRKQEVKKGETYFYRGGLLKTGFESKEYNRVFDTIYLISSLVSQDHSKHVGDLNVNKQKSKPVTQKETIPTHTDKVVQHKGTLKIAELVKDPKKYEGHTIQLSGKCVKVNPNIMDKNWIHLQDGSKDDFDLVITSNTFVPEGSEITIRGTVVMNKDFGAGYTYDLILENGTLVK